MAAGEVGVRGRRREGDIVTTAGDETTTVKRRKIESRIILSPCVVEATNSSGSTSVVAVEEECQILSSVSCCSRSEEKSKRKIEFVEFEKENGKNQTETSWIYDNFNKSEQEEESVNNKMESSTLTEIQEDVVVVESRHETVKEAEIQDFFESAEKHLKDKMLECSTKYNFDFEKDEPLGGRYEWVKLNP